jgi:hypothetical protein
MESEIKGLSLRNFPITLADIRGEEVAGRVLDALPDELSRGLREGTIVRGGWYPVGWKRELHHAACRVTGEPGLARTMGHEMTKRDLRGIYRAFVRVVSPRFVLSLGAKIFGKYFRPGSFEVIESRNGFTRVQFSKCYGFDENVWRDVAGGCEATLEVAGARSVRFHVEAGGLDDDDAMTAVAWWAGDSVAAEHRP